MFLIVSSILLPDYTVQTTACGLRYHSHLSANLVSVPPQPLVRQTGRARETLQQLVRKKHLPLSFILCTQTQRDRDFTSTERRQQG